jgi:replicative DNA helicase
VLEDKQYKCGINWLDNICGGLYEKTLTLYLGGTNVGKSIFMCNDAARFMSLGYNVVFITFEMSPKKVMKRIAANLFNIKMEEYERKEKDISWIKSKLQTFNSESWLTPGELYIKEFPTSSGTTIDVENYIAELQKEKSIHIDVIIIDYIGIMANYRNPNTENTYIKLKQISEDLRGLAVKNNSLVISAMQTGKNAWDVSDIKLADMAESSGVTHATDLIIAIIQDESMYQNKEYWLKILKMRDGGGKTSKCKFLIDYDKMQLTETEHIISL